MKSPFLSKKTKSDAPKWPDKLLQLFSDPETLEELQGDFLELHAYWLETRGRRQADFLYIWNVLKLISPLVKRRRTSPYPRTHSFQPAMIKNHLKIAFRSFSKSKSYSFINLAGLAVGMACAMLIFMIVHHETSYDVSQTNFNRIYRVETENIKEGQTYPGTYTGMLNALRTDVPEAEVIVPMRRVGGKMLSVADKRFKEPVVFTDSTLFRALDYKWISGNPGTALTQPNTIVMTRAYAEKYFGTADALGKTIRMDNSMDLNVTGVIENYPVTTSFPFDLLVSFSTIKNTEPGYDLNKWNGWGDNFQIFVLLKNGTNEDLLDTRFKTIVRKYMSDEAVEDKRFTLNKLSNLHYSSNFGGRTANVGLLKTLSFIGALVLLIACFNFINLSTARAFKRAKEVGIRKAVGSNRKSLVVQFLTEAWLITTFAAIISILICTLAMPMLASSLAIPLIINDLLTWQTLAFALALIVTTTLLAGIYPALRLSGMAPIWALKKNRLPQTNQLFTIRQGLVVVQFTVSLVLISCAILINRQLDFFRNADLGFDKSAIITVGLPDNKPEKLQALRNQLTNSAQIKNVSFSFNSASAESNWMQIMEYRRGPEVVPVKTQMKMGDAQYLDTYGIKLLAGEPLKDSDTIPFKVMINEIFLHRAGFPSAQAAVGQRVYFGDGNEFATIAGVFKDFNVNSLHQKIDPTIIQVVPNNFYQAGIKLQNENITSVQTALKHIENAWTHTFPNQVFEYQFLNETLAQAYQSESRTARLIEAATFLAMLIACMGLFGLAAFTAEQRTKEIGVRKVLGASVGSIIGLLSKDFIKLVAIAILIASPVAWYAMNEWLQNFEFKIRISWWMFLAAGLLMTFTALLTVSFQSIRAALVDPVRSLRNE